jgi:leucyl/phenylalanyl-tRNA--protein transferase
MAMYARGWFPMWDERTGRMEWVQPEERAVIPLDERFRVSRSLRSVVRSRRFVVTSDAAFEGVIDGCAARRAERPETWIGPPIRDLFLLLHRAGLAHSVEAWIVPEAGKGEGEPRLVGGLYGLCVGASFSGESMFCRPELGGTDASKACLVHLVHHLRHLGFSLLDAQLQSEHLARFGCVEIPREVFLERLARASRRHVPWEPLDPERTIAALRVGRPGDDRAGAR